MKDWTVYAHHVLDACDKLRHIREEIPTRAIFFMTVLDQGHAEVNLEWNDVGMGYGVL